MSRSACVTSPAPSTVSPRENEGGGEVEVVQSP